MLQAVGIVSEYNPFHNGHLYMLNQAKKETSADVSVAIMSGNWLQRGEPAAFDKWMVYNNYLKPAINSGVLSGCFSTKTFCPYKGYIHESIIAFILYL